MILKRIVATCFLLFVLFACAISASALGGTSSTVTFDNGSQSINTTSSNNSSSEFSKNYNNLYKASGANNLGNSLPSGVGGKLSTVGVDPSNPASSTALSGKQLINIVLQTLNEKLKAPLKALACVLGVILLSSLAESLSNGFSDPGVKDVFNFICVAVVAIMVLMPIISTATSASNDIKLCGYFMLSFIPIYAGILISSGRIATAAGYQTILLTVTEAVVQAASNFIVPLVSMHMALSVASTVPTGVNLESIATTIKKVATYILSIGMTLFIALLSLQTAITSSSDTATLRAGKFIIGSAVPIVGSNISDALASVQSCMGLLRTSVGLYAVIAMLLILLPSLIEVALWKGAMAIAAGVSDIFGLRMISSFLKAINASLSILLAIVASSFVLFVVGATIVAVAGG